MPIERKVNRSPSPGVRENVSREKLVVASLLAFFGAMTTQIKIAEAESGHEKKSAMVDADRKRAEGIFKQGKYHYGLGEFREAIILFRRAFEIKPMPDFIYNIARAWRHIGDNEKDAKAYEESIKALEEYIKLVNVDTSDGEAAKAQIVVIRAEIEKLRTSALGVPAQTSPKAPPAESGSAEPIKTPPPAPPAGAGAPPSLPEPGTAPQRRSLRFAGIKASSGVEARWDMHNLTPGALRPVYSASVAALLRRPGSRHTGGVGLDWEGDFDRQVRTQGESDGQLRDTPVPRQCVFVSGGDQIRFRSDTARLQVYAALRASLGICMHPTVTGTQNGRVVGEYPGGLAFGGRAFGGLGLDLRLFRYAGWQGNLGLETGVAAGLSVYSGEVIKPMGSQSTTIVEGSLAPAATVNLKLHLPSSSM